MTQFSGNNRPGRRLVLEPHMVKPPLFIDGDGKAALKIDPAGNVKDSGRGVALAEPTPLTRPSHGYDRVFLMMGA